MRIELGVGNDLGTLRDKRARSSASEHSNRQTLLFVSPPGRISRAMIAAIEREFHWISVMQVSDPQMAGVDFDWKVQLIIVDHSLLDAFQMYSDKLPAEHPDATVAVMTAARLDQMKQLIQVIEERPFCGILPNNVNLDICLSIIRIMLKGGAYFPHVLYQPTQPLETSDHLARAERCPHRIGPHKEGSTMMDELTARELEVLEKVAQGLQNKIIAFELGLSEHTIKIHLHNIIQKLCVHNRTEAAAKYFDHAQKLRNAQDGEAGLEEGDHDEW